MLKFEGVPLMRTGESLREMSDAEMFKILSEQEPDFSAKLCEGLTLEELDADAIKVINKETIREAVLNAIAHRSMIVQNDVVIKLSPTELTITNAGGFPIGVDKSNVLTVNSTPRSKRLAECIPTDGDLQCVL